MKKRQKFIIASRRPYSSNEYVKIVTRSFEIVQDYTCLSKILRNEMNSDQRLKKRITNVNIQSRKK